jgi:hypothetical protein
MASWNDYRKVFKCRYHKVGGKRCKNPALNGWTTCRKHRANGIPRQTRLEVE